VDALRSLPAVDRLVAELDAPHALAVAAARAVIDERRAELRAGADDAPDLVARARERLADAQRPALTRVLNATGVIVHTNLGRAPLAAAAREAVARAATGYSNLEWDRRTGARGSRHAHVEPLLIELTGAEAALAVNNNAAAVLLAAAALAGPGKELIVSRGQLVEIGGGFRIPDVVAQAGATLREVGTTNRTRRADYEAAITDDTGAILRAHPSNFRQLGFVQEVEIEELCELGPPVIDDVGSGNLAEDIEALADEPPVRRSVRAGAALVCFSGDKLLGGPQAGVMVGTAEAVAKARQHPLARALRLDKLSLAALEATLRLYRNARRDEIPSLQLLTVDDATLQARAQRLAHDLGEIVESTAKVGGGALPLLELPGPAVAIPGDAEQLAARLRAKDPPVVGRIQDGRLLLDPRTLADEEIDLVRAALS
jgi:L-seryl-tRNA(Ser) seleniumtransferase